MINKHYLEVGYLAAIFIAFVCMLASIVYLYNYSSLTPFTKALNSENAAAFKEIMVAITAERRMLLLSVAIFVAMSFGFLGFALFLIQAKSELEGEGAMGDYRMKITRLSPGLFVIFCATVIIVTSITFRINYSDTSESAESKPFTAPSNDTKSSHHATFEELDNTEPNLSKYHNMKQDSLKKN